LKALLWLRRNVEKLTGSSKGFSSVIGTIFMVLLVLTSITGVFLWTLYQNTLYNYAVRGQNQQELDVRNENVVANGNYSVSGGKVSVIANLTNAGPVTAQIVNVWVFDTSKQTYGFNNSVANKPWANLSWTTLKAGQVLKFTSNNATKVTVPNAVSGDSFSIWFVTARGNTVPLTKSQSQGTSAIVINAMTSQGIGSIAMDFKAFRSYVCTNFDSKKNSSTLGAASFSYSIRLIDYSAFSINVTNYDIKKMNITLNSGSAFWAINPPDSQGAIKGCTWRISKVANGQITWFGSGDTLNLLYNKTTTIYFGASKPGQSGLTTGAAAVNLLLTGRMWNSTYTGDYGQNLPFIAIIITS
jgi:hypothetical protein